MLHSLLVFPSSFTFSYSSFFYSHSPIPRYFHVAGQDFDPSERTVMFLMRQTMVPVCVNIPIVINPAERESIEIFIVRLVLPMGVRLGAIGEAIVTIRPELGEVTSFH